MRSRGVVVAIDGPAGSGKTTVSRRVAAELGYMVLDTGALYRAVALASLERGVEPDDFDAVGQLAEELVRDQAIALEPKADGRSRVRLGARDVSVDVRRPDVARRASLVSRVPRLRQALLGLQRSLGREGGVVVEGRDIGSVVFPDAEAKFFLTASVDQRSARRHAELAEAARDQDRTPPPSMASVRRDVVDRDRRDSSRAVAPLVRPPDAQLVDSTDLSPDGVVERIVGAVRAKLEACHAGEQPSGT